MARIAVITGAGAGVGRATALEFARQGCDVALLSRDPGRLEQAAAEARRFGVRALPLPTDVADAGAVEAAADRAEAELGPIDIWVNVAMATVFSPVSKLTAAEVERGTAVTYLGQVHGTMAALKRMTPRNRGSIICVGSALAYRSVPLQSVYCGAKFAIRGFVDSLRSEILHDKLNIKIGMVDLPAVNTPQFNWSLNKMGRRAQPVPPIFQPEIPARAIYWAATHPRRQTWIGFPTVKAILANRIAPGLIDRYLAKYGYSSQMSDELLPADAPSNLFESVPGDYGAHGRFDALARSRSWEVFTSRHRSAMWATGGARRRARAAPARQAPRHLASTSGRATPMADHYDLIVIGSGPGGASLAQKVARTGKRILMLERGDYLPRERDNWNARTVFVDAKYQATETWHGENGDTFHPGLHYFVGGNSKVYGAALLRLRERDFEQVQHKDGVSPGWPLRYDVFEPYYAEAEALFHVHGQRGEDPLEPPASGPYPYAPVSHAPQIQRLAESWSKEGVRPFHLPLGILLDEKDGVATPTSTCIKCDTFDGFPCLLNGKADAQVLCVDPTLAAHPDTFTLLTNAYVDKLETDASGRRVSKVHVTRHGQREEYSADIVVVACGALSSALLLLRSAGDHHPNGLANGSGQVGRNYMRHNMSVLMAIMREPNNTVFQKTLAVSDYYFGAPDWEYPLGLIQMCAKTHPDQIRGEELPRWLEWLPQMPFAKLAEHSMDFWLQSEDLPYPDNRVYYDGDRVVLAVHERNTEAAARLKDKLKHLMNAAGAHPVLLDRSIYLGKDIPIGGTAHQAGTARFGTDPASSVLDLDCKAHELDNLYLTDASFFPSIGAVNPTLTIIANALRVADRVTQRLGAA